MIRQCFSRLPNISLLYSHNPLRGFVLGGLALMVLAFAGPALSQTQLGSDIDGEVGDFSGYSVSLSSDGTRVAIGAPLNDSNGNNSGHVRVYRFASASSAATPVPTLPLFGLGILVSLLVLFGLRKLRQ